MHLDKCSSYYVHVYLMAESTFGEHGAHKPYVDKIFFEWWKLWPTCTSRHGVVFFCTNYNRALYILFMCYPMN